MWLCSSQFTDFIYLHSVIKYKTYKMSFTYNTKELISFLELKSSPSQLCLYQTLREIRPDLIWGMEMRKLHMEISLQVKARYRRNHIETLVQGCLEKQHINHLSDGVYPTLKPWYFSGTLSEVLLSLSCAVESFLKGRVASVAITDREAHFLPSVLHLSRARVGTGNPMLRKAISHKIWKFWQHHDCGHFGK